jgi:hypothetical protein
MCLPAPASLHELEKRNLQSSLCYAAKYSVAP